MEVDGVGIRVGPPIRMPDGSLGLPCWAWEQFTGDLVAAGTLEIDPAKRGAAWSNLPG